MDQNLGDNDEKGLCYPTGNGVTSSKGPQLGPHCYFKSCFLIIDQHHSQPTLSSQGWTGGSFPLLSAPPVSLQQESFTFLSSLFNDMPPFFKEMFLCLAAHGQHLELALQILTSV